MTKCATTNGCKSFELTGQDGAAQCKVFKVDAASLTTMNNGGRNQYDMVDSTTCSTKDNSRVTGCKNGFGKDSSGNADKCTGATTNDNAPHTLRIIAARGLDVRTPSHQVGV